jgi:hypothetical protein
MTVSPPLPPEVLSIINNVFFEWECCHLTQRPEYSSQPYKHHPRMQRPQSQAGQLSMREVAVGHALLSREIVLSWCGILGFTKDSQGLTYKHSLEYRPWLLSASCPYTVQRLVLPDAKYCCKPPWHVSCVVGVAVVSLAEQLDRDRRRKSPPESQLDFRSNQRKVECSKLRLAAGGSQPEWGPSSSSP